MELIKRMKRAWSNLWKKQNCTPQYQPLSPNVVEKAFNAKVFRCSKRISTYELLSTPDSYNKQFIINEMKKELLRNLPDEVFNVTLEEDKAGIDVEVKLLIYVKDE